MSPIPHNASRWHRFKWTTLAYLWLVYMYASVPFRLVKRFVVGIVTPKTFIGKDFEKRFEDYPLATRLSVGMMVRQYGLDEKYVFFRMPHWHPGLMRIVIYRGLFVSFIITDDQNWA